MSEGQRSRDPGSGTADPGSSTQGDAESIRGRESSLAPGLMQLCVNFWDPRPEKEKQIH